ncbi:MAG: hypothetical protein O2856_11760, partial [Planctomycetota bacterium]|nr:hypothetical protein [Planctomycetota bacterium]
MRDLVGISDAELQELTIGQQLRMFGAISVAIVCGIVSLQGMVTLFTEAKDVSLPGMNQLGGQIAWTTALVAMLAAVTFLERGVIKRRLQWAIALSLLIHFLLCVSMSVVEFRGPKPISATAAELLGTTAEEFTLPDYAGQETPTSDALWQQQSDTATPENNVDVERAETVIADSNKPQPANTPQPTSESVEKLEKMERQEQVKLAADATAEMERQTRGNELPAQHQADAPNVTTPASALPMLDVQIGQAKQQMNLPTSEREKTEFASSEQKVEAAKLEAQRDDASIQPKNVQFTSTPRARTDAKAAMSANEDVKVSSSDAQQVNLREQ